MARRWRRGRDRDDAGCDGAIQGHLKRDAAYRAGLLPAESEVEPPTLGPLAQSRDRYNSEAHLTVKPELESDAGERRLHPNNDVSYNLIFNIMQTLGTRLVGRPHGTVGITSCRAVACARSFGGGLPIVAAAAAAGMRAAAAIRV